MIPLNNAECDHCGCRADEHHGNTDECMECSCVRFIPPPLRTDPTQPLLRRADVKAWIARFEELARDLPSDLRAFCELTRAAEKKP